jgi:hypothetical protein
MLAGFAVVTVRLVRIVKVLQTEHQKLTSVEYAEEMALPAWIVKEWLTVIRVLISAEFVPEITQPALIALVSQMAPARLTNAVSAVVTAAPAVSQLQN